MFQSYAFQSYAFQTAGESTSTVRTGGHFLPIYEGKKRKNQPHGNITLIYDAAKDLDDEEVQELIEVIEPYVEEPIATKIPDFAQIDYAALEANSEAYAKFVNAIEAIQIKLAKLEQIRRDEITRKELEDEELLQFTLICCTIH